MNDEVKRKAIGLTLAMIIVVLTMLVTLTSASLGKFEPRSCVDIKTILNVSSVNISTLSYPDTTIAVHNQEMTKNGLTFNFTFCTTDQVGTYIYDYFDDQGNTYVNDFVIGYGDASGSVVVLFVVLFLIVAGAICFLAITSLGHLLNLDYDILDFAKSFGLYVVIISLYYLQQFYLNNYVMGGFLEIVVKFGWIFFILVPSVALILSLTIGTLKKKSMNVRLPQSQRRQI